MKNRNADVATRRIVEATFARLDADPLPSAGCIPHDIRSVADAASLPPYCTRQAASRIAEELFGIQIKPRTLERWPVATTLINGKAHMWTGDFLRVLEAKVAAAPVIGR